MSIFSRKIKISWQPVPLPLANSRVNGAIYQEPQLQAWGFPTDTWLQRRLEELRAKNEIAKSAGN